MKPTLAQTLFYPKNYLYKYSETPHTLVNRDFTINNIRGTNE